MIKFIVIIIAILCFAGFSFAGVLGNDYYIIKQDVNISDANINLNDLNNISGVPTNGQVLTWSGITHFWSPANVPSVGGTDTNWATGWLIFDTNMNATYVPRTDFNRGSVIFRGDTEITEDYNLFYWDNINKRLGIGTSDPQDSVHIIDGMILEHESVLADDHAFEIDVNANGFGDVKAIDIDYITGAIGVGQNEGVILINIDDLLSTGGEIFAIEVLATEGGAGTYAMKVGAEIGVIHQDSGIFINPTTGTDNTPSTDVPNMIDGTSATTTAIFEADNEYIIIGNVTQFEEIEVVLTTEASNPGIRPTFWYSTTGAGQFTEFTPVDGTDGMRHTGIVAWDQDDLVGHTTNDNTGTYDLRIIRTRNNLNTEPILGYIKTASTTEYLWDENGDINLRNIVAALDINATSFNGMTTTDMNNVWGRNGNDIFNLNSGNVGIGTTNPTGFVDISSDTTSYINLRKPTEGVDGAFNIYFTTGATGSSSTEVFAGVGGVMINDGGALTGQLEFKTNTGDSLSTKMVLDKDGQVGIGTSTPSSQLEINNDTTQTSFTMDGTRNSDDIVAGITFSNQGDSVAAVQGWRDGANNQGAIKLRVQNGGSGFLDAMFINHLANVGIGTTAPVSPLHVKGSAFPVMTVERTTTVTNSRASAFKLLTTTTGDMVDGFGGGFGFYYQDDALVEQNPAFIYAARDGSDTAGQLEFWTRVDGGAVTRAVVIDSSQKVGIGTEDPATELHVVDSTGASVVTIDGTQTSDAVFGGITFRNNNDPLATIQALRFGANDAADILFRTQATGGALTNRMIIKNGGNVGIGTTSPPELLSINSDTTDAQIYLDGNKTDNTLVGGIVILNDGDTIATIASYREGANDAGNLRFFTQPTGGGNTERMRITSDGEIGIGTIAPAEALDVDGNVIADDYLTHTWIYDGEEKAIKLIKDKTKYYKENGDINYPAFEYSYTKTKRNVPTVTGQNWEIIDENCINEYDENGTKIGETCNPIYDWVNETTIIEEEIDAISLGKEIALLKQAIYEMKTETCGKHNTFSWCE